MDIVPILPFYGTAVYGEHRFPRPALEADFDEAMRSRSGARTFGLRRTGKSTEAAACCARLKSDPAITLVELDAQGYTSEAKLLEEILRALPAKGWKERVSAAIAGDGAIAQAARDALAKFAGGQADVQAYFDPLMRAVEDTIEAKDGIVLAIDEFPWLCRSILESDLAEGRKRVDVLLAALRRWRNKGVKMLLLGSIGMSALGRRYKLDLDHLNDLAPLDVPPLEREEACALLACLVKGGSVEGWTDEHTAQLVEECSALYPAMLQNALLALSRGKRAAPLERIAGVFADKIRPEEDAVFFAQFDRRHKFYSELPDPMPGLLPKLLATVLKCGEPGIAYPDLRETAAEVEDADLGDALAILREDGFLTLRAPRNQPQQWRAASGLVAAWWAQRRGGGR